MKFKLLNRGFIRQLAILSLFYGALFLFLFNTNPRVLPAGLLLVPFGLIFVCVYLTIYFGLGLSKHFSGLSPRKKLLAVFWLAALPTFLLLLQSLHQLSWRDGILFFGFVMICVFYINRLDFKQK